MMVPRSYSYMASSLSSSPAYSEKGMGTRQMRPRSVLLERKETGRSGISSPPARIVAEPTHSEPVVIPPPSQRRAAAAASQTLRSRGQHGGRRTTPSGSAHKPDAIPPAVAALLAVTAIPPPKSTHLRRRRSLSSVDRRVSIDELVRSWREDDKPISSVGYGSPMDILLERSDDSEHDYLNSARASSEERVYPASRSTSSDSIPSIPSLGEDDHSLLSFSNLSTPGSALKRPSTERKERVLSSPPAENCALDHPLLRFSVDDYEDTIQVSLPPLETPTKVPPATLRASFKSNLTASLQALKSAAKSFSNFTAPSVPADDLLTRSLLSPRFTSEMRPKPLQGVPTPAMRRYLNPTAVARPVSRADLSTQLHEALLVGTASFDDVDNTAPMIQLQTYERRHSRSTSRRRRSPSPGSANGAIDPQSEAGRALLAPAVRQREPRENSDFLRVIVLEMNMRREGKLDAKAMGKARVWLPPRKTGAAGVQDVPGRVPRRWRGMTVDD